MEAIKNFYGRLIDLIGFIVGHTSDHGADIAIRALPILSPMPNAISMFYVSQTALGFGFWQALGFALAIEFALFGLFEVALMMFDGIQTDMRRYHYPFWLAVGVAVVVMVLIIVVVALLETAHRILAVLPLFSAAGAVALALRRWHARNMVARANALADLELVTERLEAELVDEQERSNLLERSAKHEIERLTQTLGEREIAVKGLTVEVAGLHRQIELLTQQLDKAATSVFDPHSTQEKQSAAVSSTQSRRIEILRHLTQTKKKADVNFVELGRTFGTSDTTIRKDLDWLIKHEYWENHGEWKPTQAGLNMIG